MIQLLLDVEVYRRGEDQIVRRNRVTHPRWAWLRANRGAFDIEREQTGIEIVANNRSDWIGWLELATETIGETTVEMTARVIDDVAADVLCVVEAENRPSLERFSEERLFEPYEHVMLIDGNDTRGIDVGIMAKAGVEITCMRSNVDVLDDVHRSRRCSVVTALSISASYQAVPASGCCSITSRASREVVETNAGARPKVCARSSTT